jgi:hypothetical protein
MRLVGLLNKEKKMKKYLLILLVFALSFSACQKKKEKKEEKRFTYADVKIPSFNQDSAFLYVKTQCDFGPRAPQTKAHNLCENYIVSFFEKIADTVIRQKFYTKLYNEKNVEGVNIIASFNSSKTERILLAAHWDSRLWADNDPDEKNWHSPIIGANDGASGVGVLMEIARCIKEDMPNIGVDIVLFDLEDQGAPNWDETSNIMDQSDWCLGSQYWSKNPHKPFYQARFGILLDMVGYHKPCFTKEEQSNYYASSILNNVWNMAFDRGYGSIFINELTGGVMDDHVWVNQNLNIPMIDIVQHDRTTSFFPFWHTIKDDISCISPNTLKIVGEVCLTAIYSAQ